MNAAGRDRADALARVFGLAGVTTIRTSQFIRTRQTVAPVARAEAKSSDDLVGGERAVRVAGVVAECGGDVGDAVEA